MSTPQPNASTPPTVHTPPTISVPTPVGAVQTMMSFLPPPVASQGAPPTTHPTPASHPEIPPDAHLPSHTSILAPATQIAANLNAHASASVSSYGGRAPTPPHGTARDRDPHYSFPTLPELLHHPPTSRSDLPQDVGCFGRLITSSKTVWHPRKPVRSARDCSRRSNIAEVVATKAAQKARLTEWLLNGAIGLQVLIGALTTALGAVLSGKNVQIHTHFCTTSVAISVLGGAATLVASFLARMRSSSEPDASRLRAKNLDGFLREVQAFQLDHGGDTGAKWDKEINNFRTSLENILSNRPGSVTNNPEAAVPYSGAHKGVGAADLAPGSNKDG
ncbi:hypothetical protein H4582DRAFT_2172272 [Lactarius indigo]|nr:hypothetical protein H4582DRAFT_2172272 [Lactarius indigo]